MNKITAEEALEIIRHNITQAYNYACYNKSTKQNTRILEDQTHRMVDMLLKKIKTPTFEELCGIWYSTSGLQVRKCTEYIEIYSEWSKTSYYKVYHDTNNDRVWFNPRFEAVVWSQIELLNLTIRYLESQKEKENV